MCSLNKKPCALFVGQNIATSNKEKPPYSGQILTTVLFPWCLLYFKAATLLEYLWSVIKIGGYIKKFTLYSPESLNESYPAFQLFFIWGYEAECIFPKADMQR